VRGCEEEEKKIRGKQKKKFKETVDESVCSAKVSLRLRKHSENNI
jgi:hypothetical protein